MAIEHIDRKGSYSIKVDALEKYYGNPNLIPLWVADMDFETPHCVREALQGVIDKGVYGYNYISYALELIMLDPEVLHHVTKELYPDIGAHFHTTSARVERAIRHAIEVAWDRGDVDVLSSYFGYTIQNSRGKPTNSEFIAMVADRIRLQIK